MIFGATVKGELRWFARAGLWVLGALALTAAIAYFAGVSAALAFVAVLLVALAGWFAVWLDQRRLDADSRGSGHERHRLDLPTLCAETAHEMSTPLTTVALVLGDLRRSETPPSDWKESLDLLWGQIQICRRSLSELALAANVERLGKPHVVSAKQLVLEVSNRFRLLRPTARFKLTSIPIDDSLTLQSDPTLSQALLNFLNRAADASHDSVELRVGCSSDTVVIEVLDRGTGGAPTTPPSGRGNEAGVLIAQAVVERFGGTVQVLDRAGGGTCAQIELPLSRSKEEHHDNKDRESRAAS